MEHPLVVAARDLCRAVDGPDWSAAEVRDARERLADGRDVPPEVLAAAAAVLVERLKHSAVDDGDGAAQVAFAAGTLIELGAPAEPLARILRAHLTSVLMSARRFVDRCLEALPPPNDDGTDPDDDTVVRVENRCVSRALFDALLPLDPSGGCALLYLREWVTPTIIALTRCEAELVRARADEVLRDAAASMAASDAQPLFELLDDQADPRPRK